MLLRVVAWSWCHAAVVHDVDFFSISVTVPCIPTTSTVSVRKKNVSVSYIYLVSSAITFI